MKPDKYCEDFESVHLLGNKISELRQRINEHEVNFSLTQYLRFFLIHMIGLCFLGPFMIIHSLVFPSKRYLMINLYFVRFSLISILQTFHWLCNLLSFYLVFIRGDSFNLLYMVVLANALRSSSVAGKYATYPEEKIRRIESQYVSPSEQESEMMLLDWAGQSPRIIDNEVNASLLRNGINKQLFFIAHFSGQRSSVLCSDTLKELAGANGSSLVKNERIGSKFQTFYSGEVVLKHLIRYYNSRVNKIIMFRIISIGMAIISTASFSFIKYISDSLEIRESVGILLPYYYGAISLSIFIMMMNFYLFWIRYLVDMDRKYFLLTEIGQMASLSYLERYWESKDIDYPIIDLTCVHSIHAWMILRTIASDYGKKYFNRHEIFLPVVFMCSFVNFILTMDCYFFNNIRFTTIVKQNEYKYFVSFNFVMFTLLTVMVLKTAGKLDAIFKIHRSIISENIKIISELLRFKNYYFEKVLSPEFKTELDRFYKNFCADSNSILYGKFVKEVIMKLDRTLTQKTALVEEWLGESIEKLKQNSRELLHEREYTAFRIMGVRVKDGTALQFVVLYVSIAATAYEFLK